MERGLVDADPSGMGVLQQTLLKFLIKAVDVKSQGAGPFLDVADYCLKVGVR